MFLDTPKLSLSIPEPLIEPKTANALSKPLKLTNTSKSKWDPNAPLGSEYEMPPVILANKKQIKAEKSENQETDDFFKDMAPKVETIELMQQLETMFNVNKDQPNEQIKSKPTALFSSRFGIISQDQGENQDIDNEANNWEE